MVRSLGKIAGTSTFVRFGSCPKCFVLVKNISVCTVMDYI